MQTAHESTWAWAHVVHKQEFSVTKHLWQSHEMGPFSYCRKVKVWCSKATPHWKNEWTTHSPILLMDSGALKSKVFLPDEIGSDLPVTMWYFEHSFGVVCKVPPRSSSHEWLCLFSPEEIYWLWIMCVQQDYISWLVLWSIQQFTCHWKWNAPDPAQVFICWYRTLWWFFKYWLFDEELRASILTNYTKSDTRALSIINHLTLGCWCLYYLILRWVILKSLNQITSQMVIIFPCAAWNCTTNECSEYLYSAFKDPDQYYDLWVHCMVLAGCKSTFKWVWS